MAPPNEDPRQSMTIKLPKSIGDALAHVLHKGGAVGIGLSVALELLESVNLVTLTESPEGFAVTVGGSFLSFLAGHLHLRSPKAS